MYESFLKNSIIKKWSIDFDLNHIEPPLFDEGDRERRQQRLLSCV